jgi:hypothetical protein
MDHQVLLDQLEKQVQPVILGPWEIQVHQEIPDFQVILDQQEQRVPLVQRDQPEPLEQLERRV